MCESFINGAMKSDGFFCSALQGSARLPKSERFPGKSTHYAGA